MTRVYVVCILVALCAPAWCAVPTALALEGKLLASAVVPGGLGVEVAVYGPSAVAPDEPAMVTLILAGTSSTTISSGLVLLTYPPDAVSPAGAPPPAEPPPPSGAYLPFGQWSPDFEAEWRQLLVLRPAAQGASRILAMAPLEYEGSPGELLDAVLFEQPWAEPPAGRPFRAPAEYPGLGIAFVAAEGARTKADIEKASHGAHRLKLSFPLRLKDPKATLFFWVAFTANGKHLTYGPISATLTPRPEPVTTAPPSEAPQVDEPAEGAQAGERVLVKGSTHRPGTLVVAWIEARGGAEEQPQKVQSSSVVRRFSNDEEGAFSFEVPLPPLAPGQGPVTYELHVRTEAPSFQSPETVRRLRRP